MIPGEFVLKEEDIICNPQQESLKLKVKNIGDRPIQVGSHYHFMKQTTAWILTVIRPMANVWISRQGQPFVSSRVMKKKFI